jgi:hypothetical protein
MGTLLEEQHKTLTISRSVLLRMRNVSDRLYRGNQNTHFVYGNIYFLENHAVYETMLNTVVEKGRAHKEIWRMRITCWIPKATHTHTHNM